MGVIWGEGQCFLLGHKVQVVSACFGVEKSSDAAYGQPLKLLWMSHVIFGFYYAPRQVLLTLPVPVHLR